MCTVTATHCNAPQHTATHRNTLQQKGQSTYRTYMSKYQDPHMMFTCATYSVLFPYTNESIQVRDTYTKYANDAYIHIHTIQK